MLPQTLSQCTCRLYNLSQSGSCLPIVAVLVLGCFIPPGFAQQRTCEPAPHHKLFSVLKELHPGDYWVYSVTGDIAAPPSLQAPSIPLPLGGTIVNEIQIMPFGGNPTLALVASQNLTVAGASLFGPNTPPKGIFYLNQDPVTKDVFIIGDNLGPDGTDRIAQQPKAFYPGLWSNATAYDHTLDWTSGTTTRLTLSVTGTDLITTVIGDYEVWKAPTGSIESSGAVNTGIDWWTPQLGAPVKFDTVTTLPNGGRNHVIGTLIQSNTVRSLYPVMASRLNHPRGMAFDYAGSLWITEAGVGGTGPCVDLGFQGGGVQCFGTSGAVSRIKNHRREMVTAGLGSFASTLLDQATGPNAITFRDGKPYTVIGNPGTEDASKALGSVGNEMGLLISLNRAGDGDGNHQRTPKIEALLSPYEFLYRPDQIVDPQGNPRAESNPFGIAALHDDLYATDAAGHTALKISRSGEISAIAVFPFQSFDKPAFPGGTTPVTVESVPTAIIPAPDGEGLLVADFTGFPFFPGSSRIWRVREGQQPEVFAGGFTNLMGLAAAPDGGVYALEMASNGLNSGDPAGAVIHLSPWGLRTVVTCHGLVYPTGIATGPDGGIYVSNYGIIPGKGQIVRIRPTS